MEFQARKRSDRLGATFLGTFSEKSFIRQAMVNIKTKRENYFRKVPFKFFFKDSDFVLSAWLGAGGYKTLPYTC
jgi:hypothetical protein